MQTVIHSRDFVLTSALNNFIKAQASKSMHVCDNQVERIIIRLKNLNGSKGSQDKECSVEIKLAKCPPIIVSKRSPDAYSSIRNALERGSRTALRKLRKRRTPKTYSRII